MAQSKSRYNPKEVSGMLHLSEAKVRRLCRGGELGHREGGEWVIYRYEVAARLGATAADVEQIRRLDIEATVGGDVRAALGGAA
jgi:hypothetical protein